MKKRVKATEEEQMDAWRRCALKHALEEWDCADELVRY